MITYNKGASVLRMLNHALNDDIFRTSLTSYLNTYKYKFLVVLYRKNATITDSNEYGNTGKNLK